LGGDAAGLPPELRVACRGVTAAIFGLVGVVIGGALTGGINYLMRRRDERQDARALARTLYAHLVEFRGQCKYSADLGNWLLVDQPFVLPPVWRDNELPLARLLTWDQWVGLQAVRASQDAMRRVARLSVDEQPGLRQTHLPMLTAVAIAAIDHVLPDFERLSGQREPTPKPVAPRPGQT
jgi:hypothetical protein